MMTRVRLSELARDHAQKRDALVRRYQDVFETVKKRANPLYIIKHHPALITGALAALFSAQQIFKKVSPKLNLKKRSGMLWSVLKLGWGLKLSSVVKNIVFRTVIPGAIDTVNSALRKRAARKNSLNSEPEA